MTPFEVWFGREPHFLKARLLNPNNKPCDSTRKELVFPDNVDTSASDSGYPELDQELDQELDPKTIELEK